LLAVWRLHATASRNPSAGRWTRRLRSLGRWSWRGRVAGRDADVAGSVQRDGVIDGVRAADPGASPNGANGPGGAGGSLRSRRPLGARSAGSALRTLRSQGAGGADLGADVLGSLWGVVLLPAAVLM
jgi:hypothetical protein